MADATLQPRASSLRGRLSGPRYRLCAAAGILGPGAFTLAWVVSSVRQEGVGDYRWLREHISGLAAHDARSPRVVTLGILALGGSMLAFASAVQTALGDASDGDPAPDGRVAAAVTRLGALASLIAALSRRDRMLLGRPPGEPEWRQSWRNDVHDVASLVAYVCLGAGTLALGDGLARRGRWPAPKLSRAFALSSSGALVLARSQRARPVGGVLQRAGMTIALANLGALAAALLRHPSSGPRVSHSDTHGPLGVSAAGMGR
jgi:Protein of unknown function (DUF998)